MSVQEAISKVVEELSEERQREVLDFARYLRVKSEEDTFDGLKLSESVLARDWNTAEEDEAWASL